MSLADLHIPTSNNQSINHWPWTRCFSHTIFVAKSPSVSNDVVAAVRHHKQSVAVSLCSAALQVCLAPHLHFISSSQPTHHQPRASVIVTLVYLYVLVCNNFIIICSTLPTPPHKHHPNSIQRYPVPTHIVDISSKAPNSFHSNVF